MAIASRSPKRNSEEAERFAGGGELDGTGNSESAVASRSGTIETASRGGNYCLEESHMRDQLRCHEDCLH